MKPPQRWPLHPTPVEGEALSSWLHRIARCYRMDVPDLLQHDLGHDGASDLDGAPPAALLEALARRSGLSLDQLRSMSLAGWMPWLVDRLDPDPSAFDTYVHQLSVPSVGFAQRLSKDDRPFIESFFKTLGARGLQRLSNTTCAKVQDKRGRDPAKVAVFRRRRHSARRAHSSHCSARSDRVEKRE